MSKRFTQMLAAFGFAALAVSPAAAQTTATGPYYAVPSWDQTLPSNTRFIVLSNRASAAVLDRETGLVWERSPLFASGGDPGRRTWESAQQRCHLLRVGNRLGWRLPTLEELGSLADPSVTTSPALPAGHPFLNVLPSDPQYWTATSRDADATAAYVMIFFPSFPGTTTFSKTTTFPVWCVRGGHGVDAQ